MKTLINDIELGNQTEEAEEQMPCSSSDQGHSPFTGKITGLNPVQGTKFRNDNNWFVAPHGNDFTIVRAAKVIDGKSVERLSLM